jgi:hypothetical protein
MDLIAPEVSSDPKRCRLKDFITLQVSTVPSTLIDFFQLKILILAVCDFY